MSLSAKQQGRIMDYAASALESVLLLEAYGLDPKYVRRIERAVKLLRHPPVKKSRRAKG